MKKFFLSLLTLIFFVAALAGCGPPTANGKEPPNTDPPTEPPKTEEPLEPEEKVGSLRIYDIPEGAARYETAEIWCKGERLPAYSVMVNTSQSWTPNNYRRAESGVCLFELDGAAEIVVKPKVEIDYTSVVRPFSAKITPIANLEENTLTFTFRSAGEYVLEVNGDPYNAIHFFVSAYDGEGISRYQGYSKTEIFSAGVHTAQNDKRIGAGNVVNLSSDTLVYLEDGAVVRGKFLAQNAEHIMIAGRGIIDGSAFERDADRGTVTVPLEFNDCKDVSLREFSVLDPAGWCVNFYFTQNSRIEDVKIITSRSNGDGVSLQSCKDIEVEGCFVRTWDDSLVVKNYPRWENRSQHGETENISFKHCTIWTDLAQSMELGYETVGVPFSHIAFEDITVLHAMHNAVMSIHNANNAEIKDVTFRNITIEDGRAPADGAGLIDFRILYSSNWSDQHTAPTPLGSVDGVLVENVKVLSARRFSATIGGCRDTRPNFESDHFISNVTVKNVSLAGARPTEEECRFSLIQSYLRGFTFVQEEGEVTGASFVFTQSAEYLSSLNGCAVQIISLSEEKV